MAYQQRDNSGTLFVNDRKEEDRHPDWKGNIMINGVQYDLAAWKKEGRNGEFLSLSVKPKQERRPAPQGFQAPQGFRAAQPSREDDLAF